MYSASKTLELREVLYLTNLSCEENVFPGLFVKLVPVCQQSEDVVSSITVRLEVSV